MNGKKKQDAGYPLTTHVMVVDDLTERLQSLAPSLQGDISAPHAAVLSSLTVGGSAAKQAGTSPYLGATTPPSLSAAAGLHVDPALRAENAFLDVCDDREVFDRLRGLAEEKAERISYHRRLLHSQSSIAFPSGVPAMSAKIVADKTEWALSDKALESIGYLRFLRAKRNKLKVLHYTNAIVSMMLTMLKDELNEEERMGASSSKLTAAPKPFTCPVAYHRQEGGSFAVNEAESDVSGGDEVEGEDFVFDRESGVLVVGHEGQPRVHKHAIALMREIEEEVLRVATYHMDAFVAQSHGQAQRHKMDPEEGPFDLFAILDDAWAFEASFCSAKYHLALSYFQAYRHSESWGFGLGPDYSGGDLFAGLGDGSRSSSWRGLGPHVRSFDATSPAGEAGEAGVEARWSGASSNMCLPRLLDARSQLRREILDLSFRRPGMATEDGYFASRYISATVSLELEGKLVESLSSLVADEDRRQFAAINTSSELSKEGKWRPGRSTSAPSHLIVT